MRLHNISCMSAKSDKIWELCLKRISQIRNFRQLPLPSTPHYLPHFPLQIPSFFPFLPFPPLLVCTATSQIIRFSGNASVSAYEQALSSVFYMNAAAAPSRIPLRRVTYEVTDGIFTSNTLTGLVNVTNRSPVVLLNATNQVSAFRFMSQTPPYI